MLRRMARELIPEFCYTKKDFSLDWFSGTGAGGQHRNKHQNCLRLTHIPSGIQVTAQTARDRATNQRNAFMSLKPRLTAWIKQQMKPAVDYHNTDVIRSYHEADNRVKDHASGLTMAHSEVEKRFGDLVTARRLAQSEREF